MSTDTVANVHAVSMLVRAEDGTYYRLEHAGAWDPPEGNDRSGCYYEDEEIPPGAVSLYRLYRVGRQSWFHRLAEFLATGGYSMLRRASMGDPKAGGLDEGGKDG